MRCGIPWRVANREVEAGSRVQRYGGEGQRKGWEIGNVERASIGASDLSGVVSVMYVETRRSSMPAAVLKDTMNNTKTCIIPSILPSLA